MASNYLENEIEKCYYTTQEKSILIISQNGQQWTYEINNLLVSYFEIGD